MRFAAAKWEEVVAECSGVTGMKAVALRLRSKWTHLPTEDKAVRICVSICLYVLRPCPYVPLSTPLPLPLSSPLFSLSPTCQICNLGPLSARQSTNRCHAARRAARACGLQEWEERAAAESEALAAGADKAAAAGAKRKRP